MIRRIGMFFLAVVAGYATMILFITVVQEGMFGGVTYQTSPLPQLLVAGGLTLASAAVGGVVAARIFGKPFFPPALIICGLVVLESTYMISAGRMPGPIWFDVMASGSLLFGILLGAFVVQRWKPNAAPSTSVS
jgi:hypothetical protein